MNVPLTQFSLKLVNYPSLALEPLSFTGEAALNSLYRFQIRCLAETEALRAMDKADFFRGPAEFSLQDSRLDVVDGADSFPSVARGIWKGLITAVEIGAQAGDRVILDLTLEPTLSKLAGRIQNRINLNLSSPDIIRDSLLFGGLESTQFQFKLDASQYPVREFVFQREEDLLAFVLRTAEREGVGFHYDQSQETDQVVFADSAQAYPAIMSGEEEAELSIASQAGLMSTRALSVYGFREENRVPPQRIRLRDYNWKEPNRPLEVVVPVSDHGRGETYLYGEGFETVAEGQRLGALRKEEALAAAETYRAMSSLPGLFPGGVIALKDHPLPAYNTRYLITGARLRGAQAGAASARLGLDVAGEGGDYDFRVEMTLIRLETPFRPQRLTPRPQIAGSLTCWIDGEGSGSDPEIDEDGRYKVLLPLDASGRGGGKASTWIRMAQPYVGNGYGQNFPLTPGVEALLTFVDGNPDRPVISGAVPNKETGSVVNGGKNGISAIGTRGGSGLIFGEKEGSQVLALTAGSQRGSFTITSSGGSGGGSASASGSDSDAGGDAGGGAASDASAPPPASSDSSSGGATASTLWVDVLNTVASFNNATTALSSTQTAGIEHSVSAKGTVSSLLSALIATARGAAEAGTSFYGYKEGDSVKAKVGAVDGFIYGISTAIVDGLQAINAINWGLGLHAGYKDRQKGLLPHTNLLTMEVDDDGASAVWRAKRVSTTVIMSLCAILGYASQGLDDATAAYDNSKKADGESFDGYAGTEKKVTAMANAGAKSKAAVADLMSAITAIWAMTGTGVESKGFLLSNKDSYVNVKAKGYAAFSGEGPVVVESSSNPWAQLLRLSTYENKIPSFVGAKEIGLGAGGLFQESEAVITRGKLARTLAEEVSLIARESLIAKSLERIQMVVGPATARPPLPLGLLSPECDITVDAISGEFPNIGGVEDGLEGVLLKTMGPGQNVAIRTENSGSNILVIQGGEEGASARSLILNNAGATLEAAPNVALTLATGAAPSAKLSITPETKLEFSPTSVTLALDPQCSVSLGAEGISVANAAKVTLSAGPGSSAELNPAQFKVTAPTVNYSGAELVQF
ncbi:MAG: type VI secretion system tip protein VgrG [Deltaproteobacteria bacterium]|jgi:type VI secretion system secreted protein VgrG|nr:type VI secretion system tip protein VgrG [Deltaproteobacteria bacterium]